MEKRVVGEGRFPLDGGAEELGFAIEEAKAIVEGRISRRLGSAALVASVEIGKINVGGEEVGILYTESEQGDRVKRYFLTSKDGECVELPNWRPVYVGRGPENDLNLEERGVSRDHLATWWEVLGDGNTELVVRDRNSTNGTRVSIDDRFVPKEYSDGESSFEAEGTMLRYGVGTVSRAEVSGRNLNKKNEDAYLAIPRLGSYAVYDGVGGSHRGGHLASSAASELTEQLIEAHQDIFSSGTNRSVIAGYLGAIVNKVDEELAGKFEGASQTTMTLAHVGEDDIGKFVAVSSMGDSRAYLLDRNGTLSQLTEDDSVPGMPSNYISRAAGVGKGLGQSPVAYSVEPGDTLLLTTDGVTDRGMGENDEKISEILSQRHLSGDEMVELLIGAAEKMDDRTAIVVKIGDQD